MLALLGASWAAARAASCTAAASGAVGEDWTGCGCDGGALGAMSAAVGPEITACVLGAEARSGCAGAEDTAGADVSSERCSTMAWRDGAVERVGSGAGGCADASGWVACSAAGRPLVDLCEWAIAWEAAG